MFQSGNITHGWVAPWGVEPEEPGSVTLLLLCVWTCSHTYSKT